MGHGWELLWFFAGHQQAAAWLQVWAAMSQSLCCCQAFKEGMKAIACRWRDLHDKEAQLKTYIEKSGTIIEVHLLLISLADMILSHITTCSSFPLGRQSWATASVQASLEPGSVRNRTGRTQGFIPQMWKAW